MLQYVAALRPYSHMLRSVVAIMFLDVIYNFRNIECKSPKDLRCHVGQILPFTHKGFLTQNGEVQCHLAGQSQGWNVGCLQI